MQLAMESVVAWMAPVAVDWRALLDERIWLLACKLLVTCLLALLPDSALLPLAVLILILASIIFQVHV